MLDSVRIDIDEHLKNLHKILRVSKGNEELPVAFAANALYILERNESGYTAEDYSALLLPLLKSKIEYLHGEGVAQAAWALSNAGIWDVEIWEGLKKHISEKNFDYTVVKNQRWSASYYMSMSGSEHFFEREMSQFANKLFFQGMCIYL